MFGALAAKIGARLAPLGHVPDARSYHAHLTLARTKAPRDLRGAVDALGADAIGVAWPVDHVVVYESKLRSTGAEYVPTASISLRASR